MIDHEFKRIKVKADGNCLYRSLSKFWQENRNYSRLKKKMLTFAKRHRAELCPSRDPHYDEFLRDLKTPGAWGGQESIRLFSVMFNTTVIVFSKTFNQKPFLIHESCLYDDIDLVPSGIPHQTIFLLYNNNNHYEPMELNQCDSDLEGKLDMMKKIYTEDIYLDDPLFNVDRSDDYDLHYHLKTIIDQQKKEMKKKQKTEYQRRIREEKRKKKDEQQNGKQEDQKHEKKQKKKKTKKDKKKMKEKRQKKKAEEQKKKKDIRYESAKKTKFKKIANQKEFEVQLIKLIEMSEKQGQHKYPEIMRINNVLKEIMDAIEYSEKILEPLKELRSAVFDLTIPNTTNVKESVNAFKEMLKYIKKEKVFTDEKKKELQLITLNIIFCSREYHQFICIDNLSIPKHQSKYAVETLIEFSNEIHQYEHKHCETCHQRWPEIKKKYYNPFKDLKEKNCESCFKHIRDFNNQTGPDKTSNNPFTKQNKMIPSPVPDCLKNLSFTEKLLIAKVNPVLSIYKIQGAHQQANQVQVHRTHHQHISGHH